MPFDRSYVFLSCFFALIAWGIAVRIAPVLWHLANALLIGATVALLLILWLTLSTSRSPVQYRRMRSHGPAFVRISRWEGEQGRYYNSSLYEPTALHPTSASVSESLTDIISLALRDFIQSWYKAISPNSAFLNEVDKNIRIALVELRDLVLQKDMVDMVIARIVPIVTVHLREFEDAERVVKARALNRALPESEELDLAIAAKYKDGKLHPAASLAYADTRSLQQEHLRKLLVRILPVLMQEEMLKSRTVSVLVREIVACAVMYPVLQMLSDPDTWNQVVEAYGKTTLQDRKTVRRMRAALDEHTSPVAKKQLPLEIPRLQPHDSERSFEKFVRAIRKTRTLADIRRFRSQIASQLARERVVDGQDPVYLRRLEMGKRVLDQKLAKMTNSDPIALSISANEKLPETTNKAPAWSLVDILHTASGLSYFMEFMDRQKRMVLVQYWVVVDGFRNPLEDDFGDDQNLASITWTDTDRLDIAQIAETYVMKSEMKIPQEIQDVVQDFLQAGRKATSEQYRTARMAILSSQSAVLEDLEQKYFPKFRESDLYYNFLASDDGKARQRQRSIHVNGNVSPSPAPIHLLNTTSAISRTNSHTHISKSKDLRRAALSSSDIKGLAAKTTNSNVPLRRSVEVDRPLFDDDYDNDPLSLSVQSLGNESINGDLQTEPEVIENMEAALTDIMAQSPQMIMSDSEPDALFTSPVSPQTPARPVMEETRSESALSGRARPSLAALGLVNTSGRIGVFQDNDLFGDEAKFAEDEYADHDDQKKDLDEEIQQAAPGDLGLTEAITTLSDDIERLVSQEAVVDTLTRKAELTNNIAELRILSKSKASLQREIRRKELQRQQYIVQESDNSLYGRASIDIESVMVGREEDGQEYAVYVIKVQRQAGDQMPAASWVIAHRYSEFHNLHQRLRRRYPSTRNLEFPRRRMVMKLQKQFLHNRRLALETYLRQLLRMPDVCRSREFRSFLSQQAISHPDKNGNMTQANTQDMVTRIYNSVTDGMDEFLGNIAVLDQLSVAGQNLISAATTQMSTNVSISPTNNKAPDADEVIIEPGSIAEAEAELRAFEDKELTPFVKPICDIFLEAFELNRGNNWLRGRAVVVVIHQLLGGTVERKVRDSINSLMFEESLLRYIGMARDIMWPVSPVIDEEKSSNVSHSQERKMRTPGPPRTKLQKEQSRKEAAHVLNSLIPELAGSVVGRANAQTAARKFMAVMNNRRLNEHLLHTILDEIMNFLFDGIQADKMGRTKP